MTNQHGLLSARLTTGSTMRDFLAMTLFVLLGIQVIGIAFMARITWRQSQRATQMQQLAGGDSHAN